MSTVAKDKKNHSIKIKPFHKKNIILMVVIAVVCIGVFFSGAWLFLPKATTLTQQEFVNDEYSTITAPLASGDVLEQTIYVEGRLSGISLCVATYDHVAHGVLTINLLDNTGTVVASSVTDMTTLLDNQIHSFLFDKTIEAGTGENYTLQIFTEPETNEDTIGFWKSEHTVDGYTQNAGDVPHYDTSKFVLTQNNQQLDGTLALKYTTRYAGNFIVSAYAFFAAFLTALLLLLYWCLFVQKVPLHRVFLVASIGLGIVFTLLIPFRTAPDEYAHIATSYHYSNIILGQAEIGPEGTITVRSGDEMMLENYDMSATNIFAYQDIAEGLTQKAPQGEPVAIEARTLSVFPLLFAFQTLGITLARILGLSQTWLLLMGRFANLLFFSIVVSRAIKRMPFAKPLLFSVGILPMTLQLAASFCYDTYLLAITFYFIAVAVQYAYNDKKMTIKQVVWLAILAALIAPAKTIYLLVVGLIFIIPVAKYQGKKFRILSQSGIIFAALLVWGICNFAFLQNTLSTSTTIADVANSASLATSGSTQAITEVAPAIAANGDATQFFTLGYILGHIPQTIKLLLNTVYEQSSLWLQGLLGGRLGEIIAIKIEINWIIIIGILLVLLLSALPDKNDKQLLRPMNRWLSLAIFVSVSALAVLACITWTPINYTTIFGVQGRYFLPVLPLALLAMRGKNLQFKKPAKEVLIFSMSALVIFCQLDAFFIIIGR